MTRKFDAVVGNPPFSKGLIGHDSVSRWRVIVNTAFARDYALLPPGPELGYNKLGVAFDSESDARAFLEWTRSPTWQALWQALSFTRHTHVTLRHMPLKPL